MSKRIKGFLFFLCFSLSCTLIAPYASAQALEVPSPPDLSAQSAILIEAESGVSILEKNASTRLPMASTTKIMTALVALESASPDTVITVPACAVGIEGSSIYLVEGEQLTLEELLYALLLESANDAAIAIAIGVCGSVEQFCERMNQKALRLGLQDTHFTNPHGLDDAEHYTTAEDLAQIARAALRNELIANIVATRKTTIPHAGEDGVRLLVNHNKLLRLCEDCIGVKTGYTSQSGRCLVSAAERNGVTVIAVTLNAPNDWNDHQAMFEYGFSSYARTQLCAEGEFRIPIPVVGGKDSYVLACNKQALSATLPTNHSIKVVYLHRTFEYSPICEGESLGRVSFFSDVNGDGKEEEVGSAILYASYSIEPRKQKKSLWQWIRSLFGAKS